MLSQVWLPAKLHDLVFHKVLKDDNKSDKVMDGVIPEDNHEESTNQALKDAGFSPITQQERSNVDNSRPITRVPKRGTRANSK